MKNTFRPKDSEFENGSHIERKKKATAKVLKTKTKEDKTFEYGLDDENEMIEYERFIK
jgi:hypothetical protein